MAPIPDFSCYKSETEIKFPVSYYVMDLVIDNK